MKNIAGNTYLREILRLHEDLHQVWDAARGVADDEHERDGDARARDSNLALPDDVGRVAGADHAAAGRAVPLAPLAIAPAGDEVSPAETAREALGVVEMSVVNGPVDDVVHDAHGRQRQERVEDEGQRVDVDLQQ